jgi:hypothetical protein
MEELKVLVNGRNVLDPREVRAAGICYRGFRRGYGFGRETGARGRRVLLDRRHGEESSG